MREPIIHTRYIYNILFIIEVILGAAIIFVTVLYQNILNAFMVSLEQKILMAKFFNTYVLGFQLIACYLCSLSMWRRLWCRRYTATLEILLGIWLFFCFLIIVSGIATTWSVLYSADSLVNTAELMLFQGIDLYYENPEWKLLWDQLQYNEQCCGVKSYKDWMSAKWMPKHKTCPAPTPISEKREIPKERKRRSLRGFEHYQNMYNPDRQYFESVYPRNYESFDEYPYKNRYHEYMRYGMATTQSFMDPGFDQNLRVKPIKKTSEVPMLNRNSNTNPTNNINPSNNINPTPEPEEQLRAYTTMMPQLSTTPSSTNLHGAQCTKNTTASTG